MVASASATGSCSPSLPLELVPIFLAVAVTVAEAVEKLDFKLFSAVQKTLEGVSSAGPRTVLQWPLPLAVRVQLTLRAANDPVDLARDALESLGEEPDREEDYSGWLQHQKAKWKLGRAQRKRRRGEVGGGCASYESS